MALATRKEVVDATAAQAPLGERVSGKVGTFLSQ